MLKIIMKIIWILQGIFKSENPVPACDPLSQLLGARPYRRQVAVTGFTSCPVTVVRPGPRLRLARTGQARLHSPSQVPESAIAAVGQASLVRITSAAAQLLSPPNQSLSSGACFTQTNLIRDVGRRHLFRPRRRHVPVSQLQVLFALL